MHIMRLARLAEDYFTTSKEGVGTDVTDPVQSH